MLCGFLAWTLLWLVGCSAPDAPEMEAEPERAEPEQAEPEQDTSLENHAPEEQVTETDAADGIRSAG